MPALSRRRFIAISAAAVAAGRGHASPPARRWIGIALGARASITLAHAEADRIVSLARAEIDRLEQIFSLYRADSALARLNREGTLNAPPFELVECLGIAGAVHAATGGAFDPTVQPLWATYAEACAAGAAPSEAALADALERVGWSGVMISPTRIAFKRTGMAITLNGIAQGYVADRVARLLEGEGLSDILIDTGELRALGGTPDGGGWSVNLPGDQRITLRSRALATSAPLGTVFDSAGTIGHILDPRTGLPASRLRESISVTAPTAALADALSTGLLLLGSREAAGALLTFRGCSLSS